MGRDGKFSEAFRATLEQEGVEAVRAPLRSSELCLSARRAIGRRRSNFAHVRYQDQEAVLSIADGEILDGEIRPNKLRLVQAWIEIHREELMADWLLAGQGQNVFSIDPLK